MRSDAFLFVYDITRRESLEALDWFDDLVSMEGEARSEEWMRAQVESARSRGRKAGSAAGLGLGYAPPIKIVAGNKCDLQQSREVTASQGLEWARARNCGFMETSARSIVNIEETFALIVRRVVEGRRKAEMWTGESEFGGGVVSGVGAGVGADLDGERQKLGTRRAMTKPLTPLPPESLNGENEKGGDGQCGVRRKWKEMRRKLICWK